MPKKTPVARAMRFAQEYIVDLNVTQAAVRTGYAPSTAYIHGSRLLAREDVQKEIARLKAERAERVQICADDVLREIAGIAMEKDTAPPLKNVKLKALDMLARHLGLYEKDRSQSGKSGMEAIAAAILGNVAGAGGVIVPEAGGDK